MKKFLAILVLGLLLSGCATGPAFTGTYGGHAYSVSYNIGSFIPPYCEPTVVVRNDTGSTKNVRAHLTAVTKNNINVDRVSIPFGNLLPGETAQRSGYFQRLAPYDCPNYLRIIIE